MILAPSMLSADFGILGEQLKLLVDLLVLHPGDGAPGQGAALGGGEILHRMEGEGGEIGNAAHRPAVPGRTEPLRRAFRINAGRWRTAGRNRRGCRQDPRE